MNAQKKKQSPWPILIAVLLLVALLFSSMMISSYSVHTAKVNMFDDITAMEPMSAFAVKDLTDKNLQGLIPVGSFAKQIEWENKKFDVYACEFYTQTDLDTYLQNMGRMRGITKQGQTLQEGWYISGNTFTSTHALFYYDTCVLFIDGPSQNKTMQFAKWLTATFENRIM